MADEFQSASAFPYQNLVVKGPAGGYTHYGPNPPANPQPLDQWWRTAAENLTDLDNTNGIYVYYWTGYQYAWVEMSNGVLVGAATVTRSEIEEDFIAKTGGTMTGLLTLSGDPTDNLGAVTRQFLSASLASYLPLTGGKLTGPLTLSGAPTAALQAATKKYVDDANAAAASSVGTQLSALLPKAGGTVTGELVLIDKLTLGNGNKYIQAAPSIDAIDFYAGGVWSGRLGPRADGLPYAVSLVNKEQGDLRYVRLDGGNVATGTIRSFGNSYWELNSAGALNVVAAPAATPTRAVQAVTWDGTLRYQVQVNGNVANYSGSYGTLSDERAKNPLEPAGDQLEDLMKIEVYNYTLKDDPEGNKLIGFSGQQMLTVKPGLVYEADWPGLGPVLNVKLTPMIPMLVKALQQLKMRIDALGTE